MDGDAGADPTAELDALAVEVPSWGFWRGATRFQTYWTDDDARSVEERVAAAGRVSDATGAVDTVSIHFPWDGESDADVERLRGLLDDAGLAAGSVNANLFSTRDDGPLDERLRFGSLLNPDETVREAALDHVRDCVRWMRMLDGDTLTLWLPDGTNSYGQASFFAMFDRLDEGVRRIADELREDETLLVEYKPFEPAFYATGLFDWGAAREFSRRAGDNAAVLVDLGHHLQGANVEQIVAYLARVGDLGGFHFNDSKYADDDLVTGSLDPAEVFRVFTTLREADARGHIDLHDVDYVVDQAHYVRDPTTAMVDTVENIQLAFLESALVDLDELATHREVGDVHAADRVVADARRTDVRPVLDEWREANGLPSDPADAV
jgi:L-rhamnose isomerase/sugar isomerase